MEKTNRRAALKQIMGLPVLGAACGLSAEERVLGAWQEEQNAAKATGVDAVSSATRTSWNMEQKRKLDKPIPSGKIGELEISRLILGGNLIGGWAHSRDLVYVSELVKRYHTKDKVYQTFWLAEQCGVNTFLGNPIFNVLMKDYWDETGGQIQFISDCGGSHEDFVDNVKEAIDLGCVACYLHGGIMDSWVASEKFRDVERCLDVARKSGTPIGIGAHYLSTVKGVCDKGLIPDFWMKTYHHLNYWSSESPRGECDNIFDRDPEATKEFMATRKEPWIAFKVMAAGAISPQDAFRYAFAGGADFICAGMYDFQIVDDCNICNQVLDSNPERPRPFA